jgi:uncharacterized protein (DUF2141 family)
MFLQSYSDRIFVSELILTFKLLIMKTILFTITLALTSLFLTAQNSTNEDVEGNTITVTVSLRGTGGHILLSLHNEDTFMKNPLDAASSEIKDGKAIFTFSDLKPGEYALVALHDKNDNKRMDFEPTGMPKEAFGISNNVMLMGPPQWNEAKFELGTTPIEMDIRL